jgi:hypothetical protein
MALRQPPNCGLTVPVSSAGRSSGRPRPTGLPKKRRPMLDTDRRPYRQSKRESRSPATLVWRQPMAVEGCWLAWRGWIWPCRQIRLAAFPQGMGFRRRGGLALAGRWLRRGVDTASDDSTSRPAFIYLEVELPRLFRVDVSASPSPARWCRSAAPGHDSKPPPCFPTRCLFGAGSAR